MKVHVPGKLILSGEHAVVYGQPALAMAVNRYVTTTITGGGQKRILFDLSDIAHRSHISLSALRQVKDRIKGKYRRFIRGEYSIRQVLHKPFELAQFALGLFTDSLNLSLPHGVNIHVQSDIPIGCGMGSSAATILCVMKAVSVYLNIPLSSETLFQLAMEAEHMQHGHSSGVDLRVAMQGGCVYLQGSEIQPRAVPAFSLYLINTGMPATSTGQCVERVAPYFHDAVLKNEFAQVTQAMDAALRANSVEAMLAAIRQNHVLLARIGVVPEKIQRFIQEIESAGGAAKICGAGAIAGDNAGAVLVMMDEAAPLDALCQRYQYASLPVQGEARGVHVV